MSGAFDDHAAVKLQRNTNLANIHKIVRRLMKSGMTS